MATENLVLHGHLKPATVDVLPFGYRVTATYQQSFAIDPGDPASVVPLPVSRTASVDPDGAFSIEMAPKHEIQGGIALMAVAPDGTTAGRSSVPLSAVGKDMSIAIPDPSPFSLTPTADPTLGQRIRLTGRVMGPSGQTVPAALPVMIWGVAEGSTQANARPLVVTQTQKDGYFSDLWPQNLLGSAFGTVSGGKAIPIPLAKDKRLPHRVILVTSVDVAPGDKDPCSCNAAVPRTPDALDLVNNPAAFSTDLGGGRCVDLNTPNRVLEEFSYFKVVRTTQPEIKGLTPSRPPFLPPSVVTELSGLALQPQLSTGSAAPATTFALDAALTRQTMAFPSNVTARTLAGADLTSAFRQVADLVRAINCPIPGREANLGVAIDWDNSSLPWQATTVANGHLLHFKQTWRADGYSLGDLLYSLPLAPSQKKEIAVIDWERQETATRTESLEEEEALSSLLSRDRDVSEIVGSALNQNQQGGSSTTMWGAGGGAGVGFIGSGFGIFAGAAGGGGGSSSTAWSDSSRSLSSNSLQQIRDNTLQSASAVRDQRSTVVQTSNQGETMNVETEVVANYNHCHAITMEYFEVLRHFQLTHELVDVQECLLIPLLMTYFDEEKALRWREVLEGQLLDRTLKTGFDSVQRVKTNWLNTDTPENRYSEEAPEELDGELRISFILPRPRDNDEAKFVPSNWAPYQSFLWSSAIEWWVANLERYAIADRDRIFREQAAPRIAENMIQNLRFAYVTSSGGEIEVQLDATLVSRYAEGTPLYVSIRPVGGLPSVSREEIVRFKIWFDGDLPPDARILVESGAIRYRTPHLLYFLFNEPRILNDLVSGDAVVVATPLSQQELRSPREEDRQRSRELIAHLNKHLEWFHQLIFRSFHPNRRYMLLDGFEIPDGSGRSIASVVENRLIGILGNSLVMPVARGQHLDPIFRQDIEKPIDLLAHYAPTEPIPPTRVSVPTRGVYAEAVMGECNACEKKDDTRFWRWQEAPTPDQPTPIQPVSTDSLKTTPPVVTPTPLPQPVINIQNAPAIPDPTGLNQALDILSHPGLFKDITGLEGNQKNALFALQGALSTAKFFGGKAADLAMQQETSKNIDRTLQNVKQARSNGLINDEQARAITQSALQSMVGQSRPALQAPQDSPAVQKAIDAASQSPKGEVTVTSPTESVFASFDNPDIGVDAGSTGAAFVPEFGDFTSFASIGLSIQGSIDPVAANPGHTEFVEPAASTDRSFFDNIKTKRTSTGTASDGTPFTLETTVLHGQSVLDDGVFAQVDPTDASKFKIRISGRFCFPADPKQPGRVGGTKPVPLVAIVHGNHASLSFADPVELQHTETPQSDGSVKVVSKIKAKTVTETDPSHLGYEYLQKELAKFGIASISINEVVHNFVNNFLDARAVTFLTTLDEWKKEIDGKADHPCHGMLDFDNVGFLGHSRGGDAVVRAAKLNKARSSNTSGPRAYGVRAVCSLSPTDFTGSSTDSAMILFNNDDPVTLLLNYLVVYGALDGDLTGAAEGTTGPHGTFVGTGFRLYDRAACRKAMVHVKGACHNRFNTNWGTERRVITTDAALHDAGKHQEIANFYVAGFFRFKLGGESALIRRFTRDVSPPSGVTVALQWSMSIKRGIDTFERATNEFGEARTLSLGDVIQLKDLTVRLDSSTTATSEGAHIPHVTKVAHIDLTSPVTSTQWLTDPLPTPMGSNSDWSGFTFLTFRFGRWYDVRTTIVTGNRPHLRITLKDDDNKEAVATEADFFPADAPNAPFVHRYNEFDASGTPHEQLATLLRMETIRIDLSYFKKRGVSLTKIREIRFDVDKTDKTHLFLDSVELATL